MTATVCSMRSARSTGFVAVIACALVIETSGLHLLLVRAHPVMAWSLTCSSLAALAWLVADHRALGRTTIAIGPGFMEGKVGKRLAFSVRAAEVKSVGRPMLMPINGPPKGYINATKPAAPNVLIVFRRPTAVTLFGMSRPITQIALHMDSADEVIAEWARCANLSAVHGAVE